MQVEINGQEYSVIVKRKKNKNTYIRISASKEIIVTTSIFTKTNEITRIINNNLEKIEKMLERKSNVVEEENSIYYKGQKYDLIVISNHKEIVIDGTKIYGPSLKKINSWYNQELHNYFSFLLDKTYDDFNEKIPYPKLKIRKMKSRWGVCNRRDISVTLNSHLMKYEEEVIKYVVIHELSHLVHFDHSKNFWNLVLKYCPNYKEHKKTLKS